MVIYPLTSSEADTIRWVSRIAPAVAVAITVLLGAISVASASG